MGPKPPLNNAAILDKYDYHADPSKDQDVEHAVKCDGCGKVHNSTKFVIEHWCSNMRNKVLLCQGVMVAMDSSDGENGEENE